MLTNSFKSSPLIEEAHNKQSRRCSRQRDSNEYQFRKVANPFRSQQQENYIPAGLLKEVGGMEFVTPHLVNDISWKQAVAVPRRSSVFAKHLQAMQRAVREQEQRSQTVIETKKKARVCFEEMNQQKSISIQQNVEQQQDCASLAMPDWFQVERMEHEQCFNENMEEEPQIYFYSHHELPERNQDLDDYFFL